MTSGTSTTITSYAMLATLPTLNRRVGVMIRWWNAAAETLVTSRLTATTRTGNGITRPTDYNRYTNAKAWQAVA